MLRRNANRSTQLDAADDLTIVQRAGRVAAVQASAALAAVLLVVGSVVFFVDVRTQNRQINSQLQAVAATADDVNDPPPGMELVLRDNSGKVSVSDGGQPGVGLLAGPAGFSDLKVGDTEMRAFVMTRAEGTVVALLDLAPYRAGRNGVLLSLGLAELAGILASIAVVVLFTRRSVRPLALALTLQRRFIADASHELRAPLTVLHTRAQMLASRVGDGDRGLLQHDADALVADARVLGDVVEDLLASATMTAGATPTELVNVAELATAVCDSMRTYAESLGVTISFASVDAADVNGSAAALRRALTSLIDNALAHEHQGGSVDVRVSRDDGHVIVTVADDGTGIDPQTMSTMFARFSHGGARSGATGRQPHGIGLALVRDIAHGHDGEIAVSSEPGHGATFTLTLPAAAKT
ncbi:HAMP domain-containing sensor histidine kinase [Mycobacterium sp. 852013-50091_SCH5140682]|uniref:sensor histidine kinase n=1 Tax=Mycobacterium sp. 852013-50091_SCH5140682 TaxID=1834109 RepID=UPI000A5CD2ED|nr:HAMP domain-containing sensor histidine kinase [Mycobacterium sp. 852013-50091_SCH5140682]